MCIAGDGRTKYEFVISSIQGVETLFVKRAMLCFWSWIIAFSFFCLSLLLSFCVLLSPPISPHFALRPTLQEAFLSNFLLSVSSLWVQSLDSATESFINNFLPLPSSHFAPAVCERHSNFPNPYFTHISSSLLRFPPNLSFPLSLFLRSCYSTCLETLLVSLLCSNTRCFCPKIMALYYWVPETCTVACTVNVLEHAISNLACYSVFVLFVLW